MVKTAPAQARVARWLARRLPRLLHDRRVDAAYLFGSWARGEADSWSDIDLILVASSRRTFVDRFRDYPALLREAPAGIDLLIYTPEEFRRERRVNRFLRHVLREARKIV
jgi:predicted nucleotidyltransferase